MADETENGPLGKADPGDDSGGGGNEHSPLQTRAAFIKNWGWEFIVSYNQAACQRGRAQHGHNQETYDEVKRRWEETRQKELTLIETIEFLFRCHRSAPFLFFNGNTFAEIARRIVDVLFADLPLARRREAASLAAHFVAGVLDKDSMTGAIDDLCQVADFKPGDRVKTLKGTTRGVIVRLLSDGRVVWRPLASASELMALPESLVRMKTKKD